MKDFIKLKVLTSRITCVEPYLRWLAEGKGEGLAERGGEGLLDYLREGGRDWLRGGGEILVAGGGVRDWLRMRKHGERDKQLRRCAEVFRCWTAKRFNLKVGR